MEELIRNIAEFDMKIFIRDVDSFMKEEDVTEDGHASERTVDLIESTVMIKEK